MLCHCWFFLFLSSSSATKLFLLYNTCICFHNLPSRTGHPCLGKCKYEKPILLSWFSRWLLLKWRQFKSSNILRVRAYFSLQSNNFEVEVAATVHGRFRCAIDRRSQTLSSWCLIWSFWLESLLATDGSLHQPQQSFWANLIINDLQNHLFIMLVQWHVPSSTITWFNWKW